MAECCVLGDGVVVPGFLPAQDILPTGGVVWEKERILAVGPFAELRRAYPHAKLLDARGGLILPGLINAHHHFYSALARGLDPDTPQTCFLDILEGLWWRLDRALDAKTIRVSAELSAADCIRWGCTTVFDHHSSPSCLEGSLDTLAGALESAGLSGVLCYEVSDRNGHQEARAGISENLRFLKERARHPRIRGVCGLHASFTLCDATLEEIASCQPSGAGCHIHVAEDVLDVEFSQREFGMAPVERLERFGLLGERSLLAHGVHLAREDYTAIARHGATLVHNPESNASNRVGHLDVKTATAQGCRIGLGTDGMSSAMLRALRFAFLADRANQAGGASGFTPLNGLLLNNAKVAARFFDEPLLGQLAPGAPADIIVIDAPPPTPVSGENLFAHLLFGASEAPVRHTIARGRVLLEDFQYTTLDLAEIAARARELSPSLWQRFQSLPRGTSFLGEPMDTKKERSSAQ